MKPKKKLDAQSDITKKRINYNNYHFSSSIVLYISHTFICEKCVFLPNILRIGNVFYNIVPLCSTCNALYRTNVNYTSISIYLLFVLSVKMLSMNCNRLSLCTFFTQIGIGVSTVFSPCIYMLNTNKQASNCH